MAEVGGCTGGLWLAMARRREKGSPGDAIGAYERQVERLVRQTNKDAYREAAALIRRVRRMMKRLDEGEEFGRYVASLRAAHRRKRSFISLLDGIR